MLLALAMLLAVALHPEFAEWRGWTPLFGILVAVGGYMSLILGMLYKIVPFLPGSTCRTWGRAGCLPPT